MSPPPVPSPTLRYMVSAHSPSPVFDQSPSFVVPTFEQSGVPPSFVPPERTRHVYHEVSPYTPEYNTYQVAVASPPPERPREFSLITSPHPLPSPVMQAAPSSVGSDIRPEPGSDRRRLTRPRAGRTPDGASPNPRLTSGTHSYATGATGNASDASIHPDQTA